MKDLIDQETLEAYRRGVETGVMKSATPNVVRQLIEWIDGLRANIADLRSCAHGAILDDYQETLRVLDEAGYNQGGGTLAGRVKAFIDRLVKRFSQTADKQSFSEGQELWMEWRGKFRSGHVQVVVDLGTMYVAPNLCYTTEAACRDASREPEKPTVKAKKGRAKT